MQSSPTATNASALRPLTHRLAGRESAVWLAVLLLALAPAALAACPGETYLPAQGFKKVMLSHYHPGLRGTQADTPVFVSRGAQKGGTVLVVGGTHANEPAGTLAAVVLLENARVQKGRLFIIPRANRLASLHSAPRQKKPLLFAVNIPGKGKRWFRYGSRYSDIDCGPPPAGRADETKESRKSRNLNRCYPGAVDGSLTGQVAHAIVNLIKTEKVDLAIDLHEAYQKSLLADMAVVHQRALDYAAEVLWDLSGQGIEIRLDASPKNMHGISHREWGDRTGALAVLLETRNPIQIKYSSGYCTFMAKGSPRDDKLCAAYDRFFTSRQGMASLSQRVGRHVAAVMAFIRGLGPYFQGRQGNGADKAVIVGGVPSYKDIEQKSLASFLASPAK